MNHRLAFTGIALAIASGACTSLHLTFEAQPRFLCQGAGSTKLATKLSWDTNGDATLATVPPLEGAGTVASHGERTVPVDRTTTFTMTASKGSKRMTGTQLVTVLDASKDQPIQLDPKSCTNGAALFETELPAAGWPDGIRVGTVTLSAPLTGELLVDHGGKSAPVAKGATTVTGVEGSAMAGPWRGTLKLAKCEDAPDALVLHATVTCGP